MSYGNNVNTFTFPKGMIWFCADNGFGKSTVVEALNFALFGVSYRGGNKGDLRNTKNVDSDMEVSLEFDAREHEKADWVEYRVSRVMKPSGTIKFDIAKKEDDKWVVQNKRTGYGQKDFEAEILGFNEILFKASIAQNTQETKPFMEMGVPERRKLTESIILMPTDLIKKGNLKKMSDAKCEFDIQTAEYQRLGQEIENTQNLIHQMKEERVQAIKEKTEERDRLTAEIGTKREEVNGLVAIIDANNAEASQYDAPIAELAAKLSELNVALSAEPAAKARMNSLETAAKSLNVMDAYKQSVEDSKAKYDEIVAEGSKYDIAGWTERLNVATAKKSENDSKITALDLAIRTADTNAANATRLMDEIKDRGTSMEAQPSAFQIGQPCPTCGKLYTADDMEAHAKAEAARIEKLKADLRIQWTTAKKNRDGFAEEYRNLRAERDTFVQANNDLVPVIEEMTANINQYHVQYENGKLIPAKTVYDQAVTQLNLCVAQLNSAGIPAEQLSTEITALKGVLESFDGIRTNISEVTTAKTAKENERMAVLNKNITVNQQKIAVETTIAGIASQVSRIDAEIAKLQASGGTDSLAMAEKRLVDAGIERDNAFQRIQDADDKIRICEYITAMMSDTGMKKMVFDIFVPQFNRSVQKNLRKANLPFTITFDSTMDYKYSAGPGLAPTFDMLSQGQKRKVGFAISLAFRDFVNLVGNFKVNFLSLDEVLDISTDNNAMRDMLDLVKLMADEIGCVSVITHRGDVVSDKFDYKLTITNDGAYSRLGKLERI